MNLGSLIAGAPFGRRTLLSLARSWPRLLKPEVFPVEGLRLELDLTRIPDSNYALGYLDRQEMEFLVDHCPETGTFVDIGSNLGIYSLYVASHKPKATVMAIEPAPEIVARLITNIALNNAGNVLVCDYALAEEETTKELMLNTTTNSGGNSFVVSQVPFQGFERTITVKTKTLYQSLVENGIERVDALKADVEGYEYPILKKFFSDAPQSLWPGAMVIEEFGETIARIGGSAVELAIRSGYHLLDHNNMNFFFVR
jgi:FkbM family methyltransferase